jgi:hypothetical protein
MPIAEVLPGYECFHVETRIEVYSELDALLVDHIIDHVYILSVIAAFRAVPTQSTRARLAAHPRYRPYLEPSRHNTGRLIWLLLRETQLLLTLFALIAVTRGPRKAALYRRFRPLVPYIGQSNPPPPTD